MGNPTGMALHLALHAAIAAESRGESGLPALASVRPALGTLRGRWALRVLGIRFRLAGVSVLWAAWLLAVVLVGLATSGGVVWF